MILRGGRGEGHTLNWKLPRIENLIFSLAKIEGKRKGEDILHVIRYLKVKDSKHRESEIDAGLLKLMDGDPASLDGFLTWSESGAWAEERLLVALGETNLDYNSRAMLSPITEDVENALAAKSSLRRERLKVDATVRLSGGELLCIESYLPLQQYRKSKEENGPSFFSYLRYHIRQTGFRYVVDQKKKKEREEMDEEYIPEYEKYGTADYCIIYIPSKEIFSHISSNQPEILEWSIREHRVFLTSPSTLHSTIKLLELASQGSETYHQEEFRKEIEDIREHSVYLMESFKEISASLQSATAQIEGSIGQNLKTMVHMHIEKFQDAQIEHIEALGVLDTRMTAQITQTIVLQALVKLHENKKSKYIPRSELVIQCGIMGLNRSNSRFSQILSNLEEDGLIARKSLGDVELGSIGVTLKPKSQYESYIPNSWKIRIAELFDDEGKLHFES
jgi:hypothetical protein